MDRKGASLQTLFALLAVFLLSALSAAGAARAQQREPEVFIDTSVLQELGQFDTSRNGAGPSRPVLSRPAEMPAQSILTQPPVVNFPVEYRAKKVESFNPSVDKSRSIPLPGKVVAPPAAQPFQAPVARQESAGLGSNPDKPDGDGGMLPLPLPAGTAETFENVETETARPATPAIPARKPDIAVTAAEKKNLPPLPPRRPEIQHASPEFVAEARAKENFRASSSSRAGVPSMPAVPKGRVMAQPLQKRDSAAAAAYPDDPLARALLIPDKKALAEALEKAMPEESQAKAKSMSRLLPPPLPVPAKADRGEKREAAVIDITEPVDITEEKMAAIEPASAAGHIPRPPPEPENSESEYISVAFKAGNPGLGQEQERSLEDDILPALRNNPQWRLQVQAFASAAGKDGSNGARRASLSRALAVRGWLIDRGIDPARIDVRALGAQTDRQPQDRVDFVFFDEKAQSATQ